MKMLHSYHAFMLIIIKLATSQGSDDKDIEHENWNIPKRINPVLPKEQVVQLKYRLRHVGEWLRNHKFHEIDQRYAFRGNMNQKSYFYHKFPEPPLRRLVESVANSCKLGVDYCINEIWSTYVKTPHFQVIYMKRPKYLDALKQRWKAASRKTEKRLEYAPFKNKLEQFQYKTTASYFMCYYTIRRSSLLNQFTIKKCNYNRVAIDPRTATARFDIASPDYRTDDSKFFFCAFQSFCPDVCCGKMSGPVLRKEDCQTFSGNPCFEVGDGRCEPDPENNANFDDMIKNRINVTCDCDTEKQGYRWSSVFRQCVDRNECRETMYAGSCAGEGQTCQNTIGSFMCTCRWGYKKGNDSTGCVTNEKLGYKAVDMKSKGGKPEENSLFDFKVKKVSMKVPWKLRLVYNINYYSAVILNHTLHFYNLAGFEEWVQSWNNAPAIPTSSLFTLTAAASLLTLAISL